MVQFDVLVVGGGHAGCEAAAVAARMGARVALISFTRDAIGAMSCNPAIGGLGKGHLVREVDAFDGLIARAADQAAIHYRMLNSSKGSAVQGPRVQADRTLYKLAIQTMLSRQGHLAIIEGEVAGLRLNGGVVVGVELGDGTSIAARTVVLATGTFLGGRLFRGEERFDGGRIGEPGASLLAQQLRAAGLPMARLKTGTPPRIDGRTIDWAALDEQPSDSDRWTMSPLSAGRAVPQIFCAMTRTTVQTHDIIRANLDRSPLFSGAIGAQGPRYCPSIEDKIHRFGDRDGHQVFLEPEGLDTHLVYPNGISTSLPTDVQQAFVRSMAGLARADIVVPGYAVEYDHIDPRALDHGLQVRAIPGLYCAGQINGTTGYEEAAAQGLVAGMTAAGQALGRSIALPDRATSYLAVMIDDLVLQGVTEPYRMLTARAEYRLRLRANNASDRLTGLAIANGCVAGERATWFETRQNDKSAMLGALARHASCTELASLGLPIKADGSRQSLYDWLRFPSVSLQSLAPLIDGAIALTNDLMAEIEEDAVYAPYLVRQEAELRDLRANEQIALGADIDYRAMTGLSNEMVERLALARPETLAEAGRVRGVTPAALAAILVHARRRAA